MASALLAGWRLFWYRWLMVNLSLGGDILIVVFEGLCEDTCSSAIDRRTKAAICDGGPFFHHYTKCAFTVSLILYMYNLPIIKRDMSIKTKRQSAKELVACSGVMMQTEAPKETPIRRLLC